MPRTVQYIRQSLRLHIKWEVITVMGMMVAAMAVICIYFYGIGSESARKLVCARHVHALVMALDLYSQDYDSNYPSPDDWVRQVTPYVDTLEAFQCPSDQDIRPTLRHKAFTVEVSVSYQLIKPSVSSYSSSETALCADRMLNNMLGNHKDGGNVGYADGHVKWVGLDNWIQKGLPTESMVIRGDAAAK